MRNLKRALSLTLASVMLLGMMVVGTSAAAGYSDVDAEDNVEAIEVLQAIEVMVGDDRGFGPDRPVTRNEMAVVMGKLLNLNYNYYASACPFTDVAEWARGWVGACAANGIVSGRGEGIYDGEATVTAIEAASMMMRALGYFKYTEDYADGFQLVTVRQGSEIGIFNGVGTDGNTPMTRNQVAQMALNALRSNMVTFTGTPGIEVNGVKVGYKAEYSPRTGTEAKYNAIAGLTTTILSDNGQYFIQLGEQLYDGKLKLRDNDTDAFGRPARKWEYDGKAIGTYAKVELLREEYTTKVTGKDLYELIGKGTIDDKDYDFYIAVDGETEKDVLNSQTTAEKDHYFFDRGSLLRTNTNQVGGTGNGVLTQVFVDTQHKNVYIAVINTYLAEAEVDYNEKKDEASFTLYNLDKYKNTGKLVKDKANDATQLKVSGEDFDIEDVKDGDKFLATVAEGEIQTLTEVKTIEDATITSFRVNSYLVTDGTQYDYASTARYDTATLNAYDVNNMKDTKYRVFLDNYGYVIGAEIVEDPDQYVFLTAIDADTQNRRDAIGEGTVIKLDGTTESVKIDLKKSKNAAGKTFTAGNDKHATEADGASWKYTAGNDGTGVSSLMNTWCTYSVSSDGVYTLTEVANTRAAFKSSSKAGQSHLIDPTVADVTGNKQYSNAAQPGNTASTGTIKTIDKKNISLPGIGDTNFRTVYGNDATVYMSAEIDMITAQKTLNTAGGTPPENEDAKAVIITGVDGIATGVQGANISVWNARRTVHSGGTDWTTANPYLADVSNGVYALFNDKGYVIAAITVGEDDSSSTEYAWVSSEKMDYEGYNDGKWTYAREVIIDGKETILTEVETDGDTAADIKQDLPTNNSSYLWEVKLKADGTVKSVTKITTWSPNSNNTDKFINDITYREGNGNSTIVMDYAPVVNQGPWTVRYTGNTLHVETKLDNTYRGFPVAYDANIIVVKDEEIYRDNQTVSEYNYKADISETFVNDKDGNGLKRAVNSLNDNKDFKGHIVAIFKDGVAKSVILYDQTKTEVDINNKPSGNSEGIIDVNTANPAAVIVNYEGATAPSLKDCIDAIVAELNAQGRTVTGITESSGTYAFATTGAGYPMTYYWATSGVNQQVKMTVNGKEEYYNAGATTGNAIATALNITGTTKGTYVKVDGVAQLTSAAITPAAGMELDYGYYKVTLTTTALSAAGNGGASTVGVPADMTAGSGVADKFVKAGALNVNVELTFTSATTGGVEVATSVGTITAGASIPSGKAINDKHTVTVALTQAQVVAGATITLTLANKTGADITVGGVTKSFAAGTTWNDVYTEFNIARGAEGNWAKVTKSGTPDAWADLSSAASLVDGATYEFGYYKVQYAANTNLATDDTTEAWSLNGTAMTDATAAYAKKNDTITVVLTTGNTTGIDLGAANTKATLAVTATGAASVVAAETTAYTPSVSGSGALGAGNTTYVLTGANNETFKDGVVTFTITVGTSDMTSLAVTLTKAA